MDPSQARRQLLEEHEELRAVLRRTVEIAREVLAGAPMASALRDALQLCRHLFATHNASEERLLGPILQRDFAWGQARIDRMFEEHRAEHAEIRAALEGEDNEVAARVADLEETIEAHMDAEERTFLSRGVLRDGVVTVEGSG